MRASGNDRVPVDTLVGGIACLVMGILSLLFFWFVYAYGFETQGGWLWPVALLIILFGGSIWGFVLYYQEKKEKELEREEEREKQQQTSA